MMVNKHVVTLFSILVLGSVGARSFQTGHFVMTLTDKDLHPITNATVYVKALNRTGLNAGVYDGHYTTFSAMTDTNGVSDVTFKFLTAHFDWWLDTPSHHSGEVGFRSEADVNQNYDEDFSFHVSRNAQTGEILSYRQLLDTNEYMVVRTRMALNEDETTNGWHYAKIQGIINIGRSLSFTQSVYNPRLNDTNLEFDTHENLAGSRGQSRWP